MGMKRFLSRPNRHLLQPMCHHRRMMKQVLETASRDLSPRRVYDTLSPCRRRRGAEIPFDLSVESDGETLTTVFSMSRYDRVTDLRVKLAENLNLPKNTVVTADLFCEGKRMQDNMALQNYGIPQNGKVVSIDPAMDVD